MTFIRVRSRALSHRRPVPGFVPPRGVPGRSHGALKACGGGVRLRRSLALLDPSLSAGIILRSMTWPSMLRSAGYRMLALSRATAVTASLQALQKQALQMRLIMRAVTDMVNTDADHWFGRRRRGRREQDEPSRRPKVRKRGQLPFTADRFVFRENESVFSARPGS